MKLTSRLILCCLVVPIALAAVGCGGGHDADVYDPVKIDVGTLQSSTDPEARRAAALRLASQGVLPAEYVAPLFKILENEKEDEEIRRSVAISLGNAESDEVKDRLLVIQKTLPSDSPIHAAIGEAVINY